jgi:hypothetical protein
MAKAKRQRRSKKQHFVIAKLDDTTVLAGWCVPIKDKKLAERLAALAPDPRKIVKLSSAVAVMSDQEYLAALGIFIGLGINLKE